MLVSVGPGRLALGGFLIAIGIVVGVVIVVGWFRKGRGKP